jgi:hypothetical protein
MGVFGESPSLYMVGIEELEPRYGEHGQLDEYRWRLLLTEGGTGHDDSGYLEVYVAGSAYHVGEHTDERSWMLWSLTSTHPYDRHDQGSWIDQLQAWQPVRLERGLNG